METLRIALAVVNCPVGEFEANLQKTLQWCSGAREQGADVVCFPELNLTGYAVGPEIRAAARPLDAATLQSLQECARRESIAVLAGLAERDRRGRLYATHLLIAPGGEALCYRKLHIAPPEQPLFCAGDCVPLATVAATSVGVQLCYDGHFPELTTRMALDGVEVVFMPHASPRGTPEEKLASWMRHLPARAFDNGIFLAACNQVGDNGAGLSFPGAAVVLGPDGKPCDSYTRNEEAMLVVDLNFDQLRSVRAHRMRYFLPHRRSDLDRLPRCTRRKPAQTR